MLKRLNTAQAMRYNRQIVLPQIDLEGQEHLLNSRILLIGMGGLGCNAAQSLAAAGAGSLTLVDDDVVSVTNLPRQILYREADAGQLKVTAAKQALQQHNPACNIETISTRQQPDALALLTAHHDVVLDCTDNKASRQAINAACHATSTPLISGAAIRFEGQLFMTDYQSGSPCYGCMARLFDEPELSCTEAGILAPVVAIIGLQQALAAMQLIAEFGQAPIGTLTLFDGLTGQWQRFAVPKSAQCPVCSG
ncbi:HesA/MoeB/ThiF family protein [Salinimonas sediminis]|uniref:Molybdopterin-synthase adenylyltransferase MoeB n=1 Tax=Salinimonas sediminis TaxID=2303538 RepID=A0A346NN26_9ALTE|nr:molybdopterin-synthase adenylyltransferase MoeB [Salinimonas sediminis]AXR06933.1 molybdopterin-synthase adenylyltransferase MoeB [Salinimonas sediminis]